MNNPVYLELSILRLNKILMYEDAETRFDT